MRDTKNRQSFHDLLFERFLFNFGRKKEAGWPKLPKISTNYKKHKRLYKKNVFTKRGKKNRQAKHQDWKESSPKKSVVSKFLAKAKERGSGCKKTGGGVGTTDIRICFSTRLQKVNQTYFRSRCVDDKCVLHGVEPVSEDDYYLTWIDGRRWNRLNRIITWKTDKPERKKNHGGVCVLIPIKENSKRKNGVDFQDD